MWENVKSIADVNLDDYLEWAKSVKNSIVIDWRNDPSGVNPNVYVKGEPAKITDIKLDDPLIKEIKFSWPSLRMRVVGKVCFITSKSITWEEDFVTHFESEPALINVFGVQYYEKGTLKENKPFWNPFNNPVVQRDGPIGPEVSASDTGIFTIPISGTAVASYEDAIKQLQEKVFKIETELALSETIIFQLKDAADHPNKFANLINDSEFEDVIIKLFGEVARKRLKEKGYIAIPDELYKAAIHTYKPQLDFSEPILLPKKSCSCCSEKMLEIKAGEI